MKDKIEEKLEKNKEDLLKIRDLRNKLKDDLGYMDSRFEQIREQIKEVKETKDVIAMMNYLNYTSSELIPFMKDYIINSTVLSEKLIEFLKSRLNEWETGLLD